MRHPDGVRPHPALKRPGGRAVALALLTTSIALALLATFPRAAGHGFAGFEVYGTQTLGAVGGNDSTFSLPKDGEPRWTLKISYSATEIGGDSTANITLEVRHLEAVVAEHRGPSGLISVATLDRWDYYMNWSNPLPSKVRLVYHVGFVGPPTPVELWVVLAGGPALLTAIAFVLIYDLMHGPARDERTFVEGSPQVEEMRRVLDEEDARRRGEPRKRDGTPEGTNRVREEEGRG